VNRCPDTAGGHDGTGPPGHDVASTTTKLAIEGGTIPRHLAHAHDAALHTDL
jgi:hypothetical protein